jgi:uncharacterized protein YjiS (DUF1127 family)
MIDSAISIEQGNRTAGAPASLRAALQRAWAVCITWRIEQVAIVTLNSMSDLDLQDLGLPRSEIARAVKGGRSASLRSPALGE